MRLVDYLYISLFTAVTAILGLLPPIPVSIGVPITLQTLGVMLAGNILGAKRGFMSLLVFVFLVAIGVPVLSGFRGGLGVLLGPSGGYILSWPIAAFIIGALIQKSGTLKAWKLIVANIIGGILFVYLCGVTYGSFVTQTGFIPFLLGSLAFIPGDLIKAILSSFLAIKIVKAIDPHQRNFPGKTKKDVA